MSIQLYLDEHQSLTITDYFYHTTIASVNKLLGNDNAVAKVFLGVANSFRDSYTDISYISKEIFLQCLGETQRRLRVFLNSDNLNIVMRAWCQRDSIEIFSCMFAFEHNPDKQMAQKIWAIICLLHEVGHHLTPTFNRITSNNNFKYMNTSTGTPDKVGRIKDSEKPAYGECGIETEIQLLGGFVMRTDDGYVEIVRVHNKELYIWESGNFTAKILPLDSMRTFLGKWELFQTSNDFDESMFDTIHFDNLPLSESPTLPPGGAASAQATELGDVSELDHHSYARSKANRGSVGCICAGDDCVVAKVCCGEVKRRKRRLMRDVVDD